ncbi:MAG TPA: DUF2269 family protein [Candidatus Limnocylindrales bacterium]|nr:DUF2269 family protein [Candidatus Limnocylindrales bacterium]
MSLFIALKLVHVLSAITAVGANVTYAFWLRRGGTDRERLLYSIDGVRRMDRLIANPAYIVLLVTGVLMVLTGAYSFETGWIAAAIVLYIATAIVGITLFAPALRRQQAEAERDPTSPAYAAAANRSNLLGILTVVIVIVIVYLMVAKPF